MTTTIDKDFNLADFNVYSRFAAALPVNTATIDLVETGLHNYLEEWFKQQALITGQPQLQQKKLLNIVSRILPRIMEMTKVQRVYPLVFPANTMDDEFQHDLLLLVVYDKEAFNKPPKDSMDWMWLKKAENDPLKYAFLSNHGDSSSL